MSGPSVATFHESPGGNIKESKLINSGQNTTYNEYNFMDPNVISIIQTLAQHVARSSKNQSTASADASSDPLPQAVDTGDAIQVEGYQVDVCDMMPPDPSAFPVATIADQYTRSMLERLVGYPLYEPKPLSDHSITYPCNGVNVGDVGLVREDGAFDFLFNICPPHNGSINPPNLPPNGFSLETPEHSKTREMEPLSRGTCLCPSTVTKTKSGEYICKGPEGAILVLPEGAIQHEAMNRGRFEELAKRHGVAWYEYTKTLGRSISNGSLYLVTSFTKCTRQWGIAVFHQSCNPGQGLRFGRRLCLLCRNSKPKYRWKSSSTFITKVANPNQKDAPNQCVFLRGYKIMIRKDIFDKLCNNQPPESGTAIPSSSSPQAGSSGLTQQRQPATRIRGGGPSGGPDLVSIFSRTRTRAPTVTQSDVVVLHANFNSSPIHPSDLINTALLSENLDAKIALTHDDVWCDLLRDNFPELNTERLANITRSYTSSVDEYGCVSLKKFSDLINDESSIGSPALQGPIQCPTTPNEEYTPVPTENPMPSVQERNDSCHAILYEVHEDTVIFQFGDGPYTEQERGMIRDYLSNVTAFTLWDVNDIMSTMKPHPLTPSILTLPNPQAAYGDHQIKNKHGSCAKGTRVPILQEMADWISGTDKTRMYVLSGPAGIGKSTVAYTIAARADALGLLGASLFFSRDGADRDNGKMFFTALAYQLCLHNELFAKAINAALIMKPLSDATMRDPQEQLEALVVEPLRNIVRSRIRPILIVVDALDECEEEDGLSVLAGLSQLVRDLPSFKVILTTRPQSHLDHFVHTQDDHKIFHLQHIKDQINDDTWSYPQPSPSQELAREQLENRAESGHDKVINDDTRSYPQSPSREQLQDRAESGPGPDTRTIQTHVFRPVVGLKNLKEFVSFAALYDSAEQDPGRRCHPGTRNNVLTRLRDWFDNPNATDRIFWLQGPAGSGKSAIAQTIAREYQKRGVAPTFFFSRSDASRNDGNRLFPTIAWQLIFSVPAIKDFIVDALDKTPQLPTTNIETQFEQLVAHPFQAMNSTMNSIASPVLHLAPVIIIDGVDECFDERLQRRILTVIGNAVKDIRVPFRFLITSRPEAHIEDTLNKFKDFTVSIDLASLDDSNRDIEKYLVDQLSVIASTRGLIPTWPGQEIIEEIVFKSSGFFIFASTVLRRLSDEDHVPEIELDIVRGLKPHGKMLSPFALLDELYLEILRQQRDQDFLKTFLALLVGRSSIKTRDLHKDDAMLMNVSEEKLRIKLRTMRSLLKLEPFIDVYHKSFLDFLQDSFRSGHYHASEQDGLKRYSQLIVDSVVRHVSMAIERPDCHETCRSSPEFKYIVRYCPPGIVLPVEAWQEALRPLLDLQDKLLKTSKLQSCRVTQVMRDLLLHLVILQGNSHSITVAQALESNMKETVTEWSSALVTEAQQNIPEKDLDSCLSVLLSLQKTDSLLVDEAIVDRMSSLLAFDYAEAAARVRSISDAQQLIDIVDLLANNESFLSKCGPDAARKVAYLGSEIFARVPLLPRSLVLNEPTDCSNAPLRYELSTLELVCQSAFISRILDHNHVLPVLSTSDGEDGLGFVHEQHESVHEWLERSSPDFFTRIRVMLEIARIIRYIHSRDIALFSRIIESKRFALDSNLRVKVLFIGLFAWWPREASIYGHENSDLLAECTYESNITAFADLFSSMCFGGNIGSLSDHLSVFEDARKLILRCCTEGSKSQPTMEDVVKEIETWNLV